MVMSRTLGVKRKDGDISLTASSKITHVRSRGEVFLDVSMVEGRWMVGYESLNREAELEM